MRQIEASNINVSSPNIPKKSSGNKDRNDNFSASDFPPLSTSRNKNRFPKKFGHFLLSHYFNFRKELTDRTVLI